MLFSSPHLSLTRTWTRLAGFLSLVLALIFALIFTPITPVSAVTEADILEQLRSGAATYESNQNNGIIPDDQSNISFSTPALDDQPINIDGHILIIAASIAIIAGAGTTLIIVRRRSAS